MNKNLFRIKCKIIKRCNLSSFLIFYIISHNKYRNISKKNFEPFQKENVCLCVMDESKIDF
jgi:hypothetical protein